MKMKILSPLIILLSFSFLVKGQSLEKQKNCIITSNYKYLEINNAAKRCWDQRENSIKIDYRIKPLSKSSLIYENAYKSKGVYLNYKLGNIDLDFEKFSELEYLMISYIDSLPESIGKLKSLKVLIIDEAKKIESIPDFIGNLTNLEILSIDLADNITYLTPEIENLTNLRELYLERFHSLPSNPEIDFSKFPKLEKLLLDDNFPDFLNESILGCKNLKELYTQLYQEYISELKNLQLLAINSIGEETNLKSISKLSKLEELFIIGSYRKKVIDPSISKLSKLKNLGICFSFTKTQINSIELTFPELEYFYIWSRNLDEFPKYNMPKLKYLKLKIVREDNLIAIPKSLLGYKNLEYVDLTGKGIGKIDFEVSEASFKIFKSKF